MKDFIHFLVYFFAVSLSFAVPTVYVVNSDGYWTIPNGSEEGITITTAGDSIPAQEPAYPFSIQFGVHSTDDPSIDKPPNEYPSSFIASDPYPPANDEAQKPDKRFEEMAALLRSLNDKFDGVTGDMKSIFTELLKLTQTTP